MRYGATLRNTLCAFVFGCLLGRCLVFENIASIAGAPKLRVGSQKVGSIERLDQFAYDDLRLPKSLKQSSLFVFPANITPPNSKLDTDSDGVIDALDDHPDRALPMVNPVYRVSYGGKEYVFKLSIAPDYVAVFTTRLPHTLHENGDNVADFVAKDDPYVADLVTQAKAYASADAKVNAQELLLALAKNVKYNPDAYTGELEYPKYAIETLVDQSGDCEDLSILAASLVGRLKGFDQVAFVFFPGHMGLGIKTNAQEMVDRTKNSLLIGHVEAEKTEYLYQEITDSTWVLGQIPDMYTKKKATVYQIAA